MFRTRLVVALVGMRILTMCLHVHFAPNGRHVEDDVWAQRGRTRFTSWLSLTTSFAYATHMHTLSWLLLFVVIVAVSGAFERLLCFRSFSLTKWNTPCLIGDRLLPIATHVMQSSPVQTHTHTHHMTRFLPSLCFAYIFKFQIFWKVKSFFRCSDLCLSVTARCQFLVIDLSVQ